MRISERLAVATAALSFFISTLDTGVMNVALPRLTHVLQVNAGLAAWTISLLLFGFGTGALQTPVIALSLAAFPASAQ